MTPDDYVRSGKHLPAPLRDHSDAADVFRAMHGLMDFSGGGYGRNTGVTEGHCYVIDMFLWFMAKRGYTLQRSRAPVEFRDLDTDVQAYVKQQRDTFFGILNAELTRNREAAEAAEE
jgi:hypothetical protein